MNTFQQNSDSNFNSLQVSDKSYVHYIDTNGCEVRVYASVFQIDDDEWGKCVDKHHFFLSTRYLKIVEESTLPGLQVRYAVIRHSGEIKAVLYFQVVNLSDSGLGGILNLDEYGGMASSISSRINDLLFSPGGDKTSFLLVCGNLLVSGDHGISAVDPESYSKAVHCISSIKKLISHSLGTKARLVAFMVKDFYEHENSIAAPILKKDYFLLNTDPEMIFEIHPDWKTFGDYLASLSSKYRIRANNVTAKSESIIVRELTENEIISYQERLFYLNDQVIRKAPVKLIRPSSSYFVNLKKGFGEKYKINGFFLENNLIAFTSALWNTKHFEAHYIGLDYDFNAEFNLYQNILYSYIKSAIECGSEKLYFGRTALEIKSTVGAKPVQLFCYFRFANRVINTLARPLVSSTGPRNWIPRDPFRK